MLRKTRTTLLAVFTTLAILLLLSNPISIPSYQHQIFTPTNSTLGFGTILAVSRPHSRRQPGLLWAANLTHLDIVIPPQPAWREEDLQAIRFHSNSAISEGSTKAWLGHLNALHWFLSTEKSTALIIEDDTDFDITIRTHQIPLLASSIRKLLTNTSSTLATPYWADPTQWDLLYPGHCDDATPSPSNPLTSHPHILYPDTTLPPHTLLHPDTAHFLRALRVPEQTRFLHRSFAPFCTFAYAVNRRSAHTLTKEFSRGGEGVSAFDVQLLQACGEGLRCYSVSPELFHHGDGGSDIAAVDSGVGSGGTQTGDFGGSEGRRGKGTWNVRCAARHGQLWVDEEDIQGRAAAQKNLTELLDQADPECPINLAQAERSWKGCEWGKCGAQS